MTNLFIKNMTNATLALQIRELNFKRSIAPNRYVPITEEQAHELKYDAGASEMLAAGAFIILTEEELQTQNAAKVPAAMLEMAKLRGTDDALGTSHLVLSQAEALKIVKEGTVGDFATAMKEGSEITRSNLKDAVIALQKLDPTYVTLVKNYTNVDVLKATMIKADTSL